MNKEKMMEQVMKAAYEEMNKQIGDITINANDMVKACSQATKDIVGQLKEAGLDDDGCKSTVELLNLHGATIAATLFAESFDDTPTEQLS